MADGCYNKCYRGIAENRVNMKTLEIYQKAFNDKGWFIPTYTNIGQIEKAIQYIEKGNDLVAAIEKLFSFEKLSLMAEEKYPKTKFLEDYVSIISESIKAHALGLDHIAVSGLMPVIEGVAQKIAIDQRIIQKKGNVYTKCLFMKISEHCKEKSFKEGHGEPSEIEIMMDAFLHFTKNIFYIRSDNYQFDDKTNRHGILHGSYADADYGLKINFYKTIAAVDFMTFIACFLYGGSFYPPRETCSSNKFYFNLIRLRRLGRKIN